MQLHRVEALDSKAAALLAADLIVTGLVVGGDRTLAAVPDWIVAARLDPVATHGEHAAIDRDQSSQAPTEGAMAYREPGRPHCLDRILGRILRVEPPHWRRLMERAMDRPTSEAKFEAAKIPRPYSGGSYSIQSMGRWVDRLMGDRKARADAAERVEPFLMGRDESPADPEPAEIPEPVPGGSEPITKGEDPAGKRRS
jgi:hypothetical protein